MAKEKREKARAEGAGKKGPPSEGGAPPIEGGGATAEAAAPREKKKKKFAEDGAGPAKSRGRSMRGQSKRYVAAQKKVDADKQYPVEQAVKLLKEIATGTKFNQTVNLVMHLGIDPKQADQLIRGAVSLPKGIGKTNRVIAFCEGDEAEKAKAAGAIEAGVDDLVKKVTDGWSEFDVAIAHPRSMSKVGKLGRVLGPQGKMPSPKNGTVTDQIEQAVREFAAGKIEFRNDAGGNIHAVVGKAAFSEADLCDNIQAFIGHIRRMKPTSSKGHYIKKVCISGTMSPAIQLEVAQG